MRNFFLTGENCLSGERLKNALDAESLCEKVRRRQEVFALR